MPDDPQIARSTLSRHQVEKLQIALRSVVNAWNDPGPMGTIYEMTRAVGYAMDVLEEIER